MAAISEARGSISIEHNFKVEEIEEGASTNGATSTTPSPNNKRRQKKPPQMSPENGELNWNCSKVSGRKGCCGNFIPRIM